MLNKKKEIIVVLAAILIIGSSYYIYSANKESARKDSIESLTSETIAVDEIENHMKDLEYEPSDENSGENSFGFSKTSGDMIDTIYSSDPLSTYSLLYMSDYDENKANLILTRAYADKEIIYSLSNEDKNYIKVEVSYYKVCKANCDSSNYEVKFDHYLYNIKDETLKAEPTNNNSLTVSDIKNDIDYYFKELSKIY